MHAAHAAHRRSASNTSAEIIEVVVLAETPKEIAHAEAFSRDLAVTIHCMSQSDFVSYSSSRRRCWCEDGTVIMAVDARVHCGARVAGLTEFGALVYNLRAWPEARVFSVSFSDEFFVPSPTPSSNRQNLGVPVSANPRGYGGVNWPLHVRCHPAVEITATATARPSPTPDIALSPQLEDSRLPLLNVLSPLLDIKMFGERDLLVEEDMLLQKVMVASWPDPPLISRDQLLWLTGFDQFEISRILQDCAPCYGSIVGITGLKARPDALSTLCGCSRWCISCENLYQDLTETVHASLLCDAVAGVLAGESLRRLAR